MQKIALSIAILLFVYLMYRYINMKPVDKKQPEVAAPNEPETVPAVSIKDEDKDKEE